MTLVDIERMPGFNPDGPRNGIDSVTRGVISFGPLPGSLDTVRCVKHGACNCVAVMPVGKLWRCLACNEGAFAPTEAET